MGEMMTDLLRLAEKAVDLAANNGGLCGIGRGAHCWLRG